MLGEPVEKSEFLSFKARHEFGDVTPPYDPRKDRAAQDELLSIAADYADDGWWGEFFEDRGRRGGIFVAEAKDEVKED